MNPTIKAEWITALTSTEYEQGTGELRTREDHFCCLGVLCDLAVKSGIAKWEWTSDSGWLVLPIDQSRDTASSDDVGGATVPRFIQDWSGLDSPNPPIKLNKKNEDDHSLAFYNDGEGWNFSQIAVLIDEHL